MKLGIETLTISKVLNLLQVSMKDTSLKSCFRDPVSLCWTGESTWFNLRLN